MADKPSYRTPDEQLLAIWLHGRPAATVRVYRRHVLELAKSADLVDVTLEQLQAFVTAYSDRAPRTQGQRIAAVKSFYAFHAKLGTLERNPALPLREPKIPGDLAERILTEAEVDRLIAGAERFVERLCLQVLYRLALRASELCGLTWRALVARGEGGQVTVTGKGGKTRTVLVPAELYGDLLALQPDDARPSDPVFRGFGDTIAPLGARQLLRIVKKAAKNAGLSEKISAHWLRHSHASHALDANCPITLVRDTLGHGSLATTNRYSHARPNDGSARFLERS